jgi:PAS domain S-box-containing protein
VPSKEKVLHARLIGAELGPLFDGARLPIIVLLPGDGRFVAANAVAVRQYGYSLEELLELRIQDLIVGEHDVANDFEMVVRGEGSLKRRRHRRKDGSLLWVLPAAGPMILSGERHVVSVPQDVTAIVDAEARAKKDEERADAFWSELISADRLATIGRLAAGVAHEVNNPAALVTVNLGVLRDRFAAGTPRLGEAITMLDESLEGMRRIHEMVRDLKGFARERAREKIDLSELVSSAVRMAAHATRGHAKVHKDLEHGVYTVVRGARVAQVVLNLLINAAQAIPRGHPNEHTITVRTFQDQGLACIEIADSGNGVPPEIAHRIFEPFFTTREKTGGTGLGLWLAREIVEEEGGQIVLCEGPGGAKFLVSLAAASPEPSDRLAPSFS